ncbi:hypothetical protein [Athalassotoga saccharophila]|uniref:hypothetical protein n=1 Tax=Athalassotoga saccharophila TaxID=1441386 RepID=UPI00137B8511|nr:hypothetical protein [Athalassotoga saccharophila]BBJ27505.1 hypothetical protein ATHSA_0374 [Athalassotoga saccharophila]
MIRFIESKIVDYLSFCKTEEEISRNISFSFPVHLFLSKDGHLSSPEIRIALCDLADKGKINIDKSMIFHKDHIAR